MGWRDTQTAVQSGELSFVQKEDAFGEAFKTGANILAKSMIQKAADKKEEDKRIAAEQAAERKRINAAQDKAAAAEEKMKANAKILSQNYTGDTQPKTVQYFFQQLQLNDGDVGNVETSTQTRLDNNTLNFIASTTEVVGSEKVTARGQVDPRDPPRVRPSDRTDAQMKSLKFGSQDPDLGNYYTSAKQYSDVLEVTEGQVNINPQGKPDYEVDFSALKTLDAVNGVLLNIKTQGRQVSEDTNKELKDLQARYKTRDDSKWQNDVKDLDDAKAAVVQLRAANKTAQVKVAEQMVANYMGFEDPSWTALLEPTDLIGNTAQELRERKALATNLGAKPDDLVLINRSIAAQDLIEKDAQNLAYIEKSTTESNALLQADLAEIAGAPQETITHLKEIAQRLAIDKVKQARQKNGIFNDTVYPAVITDPETKEQRFEILIRDPDGNVTLSKDGTSADNLRPREMVEAEAESFFKLSIQVQKNITALNATQAALAEGLRNSELAISLAENNPMVRNVGGRLAQGITSTVRGTESSFTVLQSLLETSTKSGKDLVTGEEVKFVTQEQLVQALKAQNKDQSFLDAIVSKDVQNLADDTARFEAAMIILAFRTGRMEGQSGNAMSNKDFDRLKKMLTTDGSIEAFSQNMRDYMKSKIESYDDKAFGLENTGPIETFKRNFGWSPVTIPVSFEEFVEKRGSDTLTTAFTNTMSGKTAAPVVAPVVAPAAVVAEPKVTYREVTEDAKTALLDNPSKAAEFDLLFGPGAAARILGGE